MDVGADPRRSEAPGGGQTSITMGARDEWRCIPVARGRIRTDLALSGVASYPHGAGTSLALVPRRGPPPSCQVFLPTTTTHDRLVTSTVATPGGSRTDG
jgi:hypothetical protein